MPSPCGGLYQATGALGSNSCATVQCDVARVERFTSTDNAGQYIVAVAHDGVVTISLYDDLGIVIGVLNDDREGVVARERANDRFIRVVVFLFRHQVERVFTSATRSIIARAHNQIVIAVATAQRVAALVIA